MHDAPRTNDPAATVGQLLAAAARRLPGDEARAEAERLLAHALGVGPTWLYTHRDDVPPAEKVAGFERLLDRRLAGEPIAYLIGHRGFWRFDLAVTPATLIPRPETERLVELALERLPEGRPLRVADLGTGTGAIALAMAFERPLAQVVATDASAAALAIAQGNARRWGCRAWSSARATGSARSPGNASTSSRAIRPTSRGTTRT